MVRITDLNGADVIRYLRLCGGTLFFGGNTWSRSDGFAPGIHDMRTLKGMLDLIAKIANTPAEPHESYRIDGRGRFAMISREMNVRDLAQILGCDEQVIRDHFEPLVSLT